VADDRSVREELGDGLDFEGPACRSLRARQEQTRRQRHPAAMAYTDSPSAIPDLACEDVPRGDFARTCRALGPTIAMWDRAYHLPAARYGLCGCSRSGRPHRLVSGGTHPRSLTAVNFVRSRTQQRAEVLLETGMLTCVDSAAQV
jgi:hypothetical protein